MEAYIPGRCEMKLNMEMVFVFSLMALDMRANGRKIWPMESEN